MTAANEIAPKVGVEPACDALAVSRATYYRWFGKRTAPTPKPRKKPARALAEHERREIVATLHSDRFVDKAPTEVYATLLDEGTYMASARTMYRILAAEGEVRERRNQVRRPNYAAPELLATAPNQVWSWDITKLLGPEKWSYYYLYVILDIFSRYVVGWTVARRELGLLATDLVAASCEKQHIERGQLTLHADRGSPMKARTLAQTLVDLGVERSHSRPHVSNDNPFSESQFKTLKYCPTFPGRFYTIEEARAFCRAFFAWYNDEHRHSGIGYMTPHAVHYGRAEGIRVERAATLLRAYEAHPERFVRKPPVPPALPTAVYINPPKKKGLDSDHLH